MSTAYRGQSHVHSAGGGACSCPPLPFCSAPLSIAPSQIALAPFLGHCLGLGRPSYPPSKSLTSLVQTTKEEVGTFGGILCSPDQAIHVPLRVTHGCSWNRQSARSLDTGACGTKGQMSLLGEDGQWAGGSYSLLGKPHRLLPGS